MANIDESIEWAVRGDNALTSTHHGHPAVRELWAKLASKDYRTEPHEFLADGDKVIRPGHHQRRRRDGRKRRRADLQRRRQGRRVRLVWQLDHVRPRVPEVASGCCA
jgi:hypothetical protein